MCILVIVVLAYQCTAHQWTMAMVMRYRTIKQMKCKKSTQNQDERTKIICYMTPINVIIAHPQTIRRKIIYSFHFSSSAPAATSAVDCCWVRVFKWRFGWCMCVCVGCIILYKNHWNVHNNKKGIEIMFYESIDIERAHNDLSPTIDFCCLRFVEYLER